MKIRNGFVSNSSSSSFIIFTGHTKKSLNTIDEVKKYFFKDGYDEEDIKYVLTDKIIDKIENEIEKGLGCIIINADYWSENILIDIVDKLGTDMIELKLM